ncbi:LPD38 domain-containing protein [Cytobacillus oceanisediminis]|uniref:LPD38 domain-containing protein n=1 Tax=Cytobacillus oceanisediminis TaxID=665099 RepID=UPI0020406347|nr:LPD38 domain-containing protein [Cytobacillus oceanisediminis]MCM3405929.1 hypothetical protein [Cytobacillus oceanisediminis]
MSFNQQKYKKIFEQRYGKGAYDSGLSAARSIGSTAGKAEVAKLEYARRLAEAKKAAENKTYDDALSFWNDPANNSALRKEGASRNAENIRNDPRLRTQIQDQGYNVDDYIDAMYNAASNGHFRSEREFKQFSDSQSKAVSQKPTFEQQLAQYSPKKTVAPPQVKKKDIGLLGRIGDFFTSKDVDGDGDRDGLLGAVDRFVTPISKAATDSFIPGNTERMAQNDPDNPVVKAAQKDRGLETDILNGVGTLAAFAAPYSQAYKAANLAVNKVPSLARIANPYAKKAVTGALAGGTVEAGVSATNELANSEAHNMADYATRMGLGMAGGAILDPALHGLGKLAQNGLGKLAKGNVPAYSGGPSNDILERLRPISNRNSAVQSNGLFDNLIVNSREPENLLPKIGENKVNRTVEPPSLNRLKALKDYESIESSRGSFLPLVRNESAATAEGARTIGEGFERLRNFNQDPEKLVTSFRSKVDREPKGTNKIKEAFSNLRTQFVDDLAPLERLEKGIRGSVSSAENSLYKQGRLFRGTSEKSNQIVETRLSPILKDIQKAGYTADDLGDYALAVHAKDVNEKGIKSGFTNQEINAVIQKFESPVMEKARKDLLGLNNSLLNSLADAGIMTKDAVEQLQKKHPNYMPLFRSFDDDKVEFASGLQKSLANVANPIKKLEGSDRNVIDPLESVVQNIFRLNNAADRNKVASQIGKLAADDTEGAFIRRLNPGEEVGRKNVVSAWEDGQKVQYEVPPEVYKTMMNLDKESSNFLIKILQKPAGTLRAGATLTPEFSLRNPMRDVVQAFVVSNSGFNPIVDFPVGLFQSAMKGRSIKIAGKEFKTPDKMYRQFIEDNGGLGNIVSIDRDLHRQSIEKALKGSDKRFINVVNPKAWMGVLRAIADVSESATKVGEYRAALRSGASRQEAAYRARDIMDFARSGVSVREANKVVAFLNANVQGKSKLLRAIKENPTKVSMKSLQAITLPTVGVFMAQKYLASDEQKSLIEDAPSWLKNSFWLIPVPGTEQVARIPKPFDLAPIFANLPERSLEYFAKNDPAAFDNFARETFSSYAIPTMLTGLAPLVEGMANYSFFREGPIIPQREKNLNFPDQYDINTSETAKALGKGINKLTGGTGTFKNFGSPRVVDNTIRGFTGGLGTYVTDAVDLIVEGSGMVDEVERPEKDPLTEQTPLRAFLMNKSSTGKSVDMLYTSKDKLTRERGSFKSKELEYPKEEEYQFINAATKEIGEISKLMRTVENDPNMNGEQKRQALDKLNKARNYLAVRVRRATSGQN